MIDILGRGATTCLLVDTCVIVNKFVSSFKRYWHWPNTVHSFSQLLFIALSYIVAAKPHVTNGYLWPVVAFAIPSCVWIGCLGFQTSCVSDVFESLRRKPAVTAVVFKGTCAVDKLLFREQNVASLAKNVPVWFHCAHCGESPAWSAVALVLDWGNHTLLQPIVVCGNAYFLLGNLESISGGTILWGHEFLFLELFKSHITEIINTLGPRVTGFVVLNKLSQLRLEDTKPVLRFREILGRKLPIDFLSNLTG